MGFPHLSHFPAPDLKRKEQAIEVEEGIGGRQKSRLEIGQFSIDFVGFLSIL
jgi:hypothetical protein